MSKELPYFQFEPAEYLASDISICSLEAQGLFVNIECLYWQKDCSLKVIQIERRYNQPKVLQELIDENIIRIKGEFIIIDFLIQQRDALIKRKSRLSAAGSKGAAKRTENQQDNKPPLIENEATLKQPDKIRRDNKRKDNNILNAIALSFCPFYLDEDFQLVWIDFEKVRQKKKATKSERSYKAIFKKLLLFSAGDKMKAIEIVAKSADSGWSDLYELNGQGNKKVTPVTTNR